MSDMEERFIKLLCECRDLDPTTISPATNFAEDLNMDSLDGVEVMMECEEEFEFLIPDEAAERLRTVGDAVEYLEGRRDGMTAV